MQAAINFFQHVFTLLHYSVREMVSPLRGTAHRHGLYPPGLCTGSKNEAISLPAE